ncbi:hypothetical protein ACVWWH_000966 [Sinomonas sp. RB5]
MAEGVAAELEGRDWDAVLAERDRLLLALLAAKAQAPQIP